ncbi:unnamed protein product [Victoria cruziana]
MKNYSLTDLFPSIPISYSSEIRSVASHGVLCRSSCSIPVYYLYCVLTKTFYSPTDVAATPFSGLLHVQQQVFGRRRKHNFTLVLHCVSRCLSRWVLVACSSFSSPSSSFHRLHHRSNKENQPCSIGSAPLARSHQGSPLQASPRTATPPPPVVGSSSNEMACRYCSPRHGWV